ncbi:hypothetical protein [Frankia sp. AgB32]|uniref:hypothetical protein n=1 Tax=Frankia sp. AgB32 TaxID=631119 RepID=UPI00200F65C8|nr:hypothetical protein [Frankia sp. AgB32]MCK9896443.1 hypothetical protein [Frankia sp. AgB32]
MSPAPLRSRRWPALAGHARAHGAPAAAVGVGLVVTVTGLATGGHSAPSRTHHALGWVALYALGVALMPLARLVLRTARMDAGSGQPRPTARPDPCAGQGAATARSDRSADEPGCHPGGNSAGGDEERTQVGRTAVEGSGKRAGPRGGGPPRPSGPVDHGWRLLDDPICPHCGTEHAIIADFYCDHCDHEWTIEPGDPWPDLLVDPTAPVPAPAALADPPSPARPPDRT